MTRIINKRCIHFIIWVIFLTAFMTGCTDNADKIVISPKSIQNYTQHNWLEDTTKFPLTGNFSISSNQYSLKKGKYSIQLRAYGTPGENRLPRLLIDFGPYQLKVLNVDLQPNMYFVNFELPEAVNDKFIFTFNDDYNSSTEDRNVFLYFPIIVRKL